MSKECGTCTACCEGSLHGVIKGNDFGLTQDIVLSPGVPCFFLDKGCTVYEIRPTEPCRSFQCIWLSINDCPDYVKPEQSGLILDIFTKLDPFERYVRITRIREDYSKEAITWAIEYAKKNGINYRYNNI